MSQLAETSKIQSLESEPRPRRFWRSNRRGNFSALPRVLKAVLLGWLLVALVQTAMAFLEMSVRNLDFEMLSSTALVTDFVGTLWVGLVWLIPLGLYYRRRFARPVGMVLSAIYGVGFTVHCANNAAYLAVDGLQVVPLLACLLGLVCLAVCAFSYQVLWRMGPLMPVQLPNLPVQPPAA